MATAVINGREMHTTFWQDFSIADRFGIAAVKDTYKRAFDEWSYDVEYMGEFVAVLNWKIWQHWENGREKLARVYNDLWQQADAWCVENYTGDDARRYWELTD